MKKKTHIATLVGASLLTTATSAAPNGGPPPLQNSQEAVQFFSHELNFKTNPYGVNKVVTGSVKNILIVDVRSAKDYAAGHIPGAINIPGDEHNYFDGSEKEFSGLQKDKFHYIYCYTPFCNLAQKAAKKFASLGYPVKEMVGGWEEWVKDGYRVEK